MLLLVTISLLLILFSYKIRPELTYTILFISLFALWVGTSLPLWVLAVSSIAVWLLVEAAIAQVEPAIKRHYLFAWRYGNMRLAVARLVV